MKNSSTSSSERSSLRGRLVTAGFVLVGTVAGVLALNAWARPAEGQRDIWYGPVADYLSQGGRFSHLFLGTSRTRAAVRPEVFDSIVGRAYGTPLQSINLGIGHCTLIEHWFGLRKLLEIDPLALQGVVVLIEAPAGLPAFLGWHENWIVQGRTDLLTPYLKKDDLWRLWKVAGTPAAEKFVITANLVAPYVEHIPRARSMAMAELDTLLARVFSPIVGAGVSGATTGADLVAEGGIRTDAKGVETAREMAIRMAREDAQNQASWSNWDTTAIRDVVNLVREAGGYPVFFEMPLSDVQMAPYRMPVRTKDREDFPATLAAWKVPMLKLDFPHDSTDFPDLWHLRKTRAPEFTAALARSYIEASRPAAPAAQPDTSAVLTDSVLTGG